MAIVAVFDTPGQFGEIILPILRDLGFADVQPKEYVWCELAVV